MGSVNDLNVAAGGSCGNAGFLLALQQIAVEFCVNLVGAGQPDQLQLFFGDLLQKSTALAKRHIDVGQLLFNASFRQGGGAVNLLAHLVHLVVDFNHFRMCRGEFAQQVKSIRPQGEELVDIFRNTRQVTNG